MPLEPFPLPLVALPEGFDWERRSISQVSTTTAFNTGIDRRDVFRGQRCCIVCGESAVVEHGYIIRESEPDVWRELRERGWVPREAKGHVHEPRNGLLLCPNHHKKFDGYRYFIRYVPQVQRFVFVNYTGDYMDRGFNGKAIALDVADKHAPFPCLFIIHEMRVRGHNPFRPVNIDVPAEYAWQDWITTQDVLREDGGPGLFHRDGLGLFRGGSSGEGSYLDPLPQLPATTAETNTGGSSGTGPTTGISLALNQNVISEILAASRAMPSWKACVMEGTSWEGSAEENIEKYVKNVGIDPEEAHEDSDT